MAGISTLGGTWLIVAAALAGGATPAPESKVKWSTDFEHAARESERLGKPLLVEFTASWCGYCQKMQQTTFADERVAKHVDCCFIPVSVDADENERLMHAVGIEGLPTTVILSPELKVVKRITGYQTPEQFRQHLVTVCACEEPAQPPERQTVWAAARNRVGGTIDSLPEIRPRRAPEPLADAFDRLCLVSLRDDQQLRRGQAAHALTFRGRRLYFQSAEHQDRFASDPDRYWPVLDGQCAVSAAERLQPNPGDPKLALIYRGRVWFIADRPRLEEFYRNPSRYAAAIDVER